MCHSHSNEISYTELVEAYLAERVLRERSRSTYRQCISLLERSIPGIPNELTREMLLQWRASELERGLAVVSWNARVHHLKPIFAHAIKSGFINQIPNPFEYLTVKPPRKPKKTLSSYKITQIRDYLQQQQDAEDNCRQDVGRLHPVWFWRTVFETLLESGIRRNQLLHLKCSDINLKQMAIHIDIEGSKTHRVYDVPISETLLPWLARLLREAQQKNFHHGDQLFNITRFSDRGFSKERMDGDHVGALFTDLSKRLGFKASPHRFRHTLATELMRCPEANLHLVKEMLGHTNLATTLEYIEPDMDGMRRMLNNRHQIHSHTGGGCQEKTSQWTLTSPVRLCNLEP